MSKKNVIILFTLSVLFFSLSLVGVYVFALEGDPGHSADYIGSGSFGSMVQGDSGNWIFNNGGNVGIGTTSPKDDLSIKKSSETNSGISISAGRTDDYRYRIRSVNSNSYLGIGYWTTDWYPTAGVPTVALTYTGNVGIGTTSPSYKLHVAGTGYFNGSLGVSGGLTVGSGKEGEWTPLYLLGDNHWLLNAHNGSVADERDGAFAIRKCSSYSGDICTAWNNFYLMITSGGNVGIGTTSPSQKLTVNSVMQAFSTDDKFITLYAGSDVRTIIFDNSDSLQIGTWNTRFGGGYNTLMTMDYLGNTTFARGISVKLGYINIDRPSADSAELALRSGDSSLPTRIRLSTGRYGDEAIISVPNNDLYMYIGANHALVIRDQNTEDNAQLHVKEVHSTSLKALSGTLISGTRSNFKLVLQSDRNMVLYDNGAAIWATDTSTSDIRLKKNIQKLDNVLGKILKWDVVKFNWIDRLNWGDKKEIGLIAQQVEKDFPEVVYTDKNGYKLINYEKLTPILLQGIREQQNRIEDLEKRVERLEKNNLSVNRAQSFWQRIFGR